jgi:hypothetical protein
MIRTAVVLCSALFDTYASADNAVVMTRMLQEGNWERVSQRKLRREPPGLGVFLTTGSLPAECQRSTCSAGEQ